MREHHAESNGTDAAVSLQAEVEELRRRLAALEACAPGQAAGRTVARKRRARPTAKGVALLVAGVVLAAATVVYGQSAVEALFVSREGNVGVGTTAPAVKVDVNGSLRVAGKCPRVVPSTQGGYLSWNQMTCGTGETDFINHQGGGRGGFWFANTADGSNLASLMLISGNGNVGIGTDVPSNKLSVAGDADVSGTLTSGTLTAKNSLRADGTSVLNNLQVSSDLSVGGTIRSQGSLERYQRDDQAETTYKVSPRYHLSLTAAAYAGRTRRIPQQTLNDLCGDQDGCEVRLAMTRYAADAGSQAASVSALFYYSEADGRWRTNAVTGGAADVKSKETIGVDGRDGTQHIINAWGTCYFTDATYSGFKDEGDTAIGLYLLVWNTFTYPNRTCELTLID